MTNAELVDALHRAMRELERVGEQSVIVEARVRGVETILQDMIDRILEDEIDAKLNKSFGGCSMSELIHFYYINL